MCIYILYILHSISIHVFYLRFSPISWADYEVLRRSTQTQTLNFNKPSKPIPSLKTHRAWWLAAGSGAGPDDKGAAVWAGCAGKAAGFGAGLDDKGAAVWGGCAGAGFGILGTAVAGIGGCATKAIAGFGIFGTGGPELWGGCAGKEAAFIATDVTGAVPGSAPARASYRQGLLESLRIKGLYHIPEFITGQRITSEALQIQPTGPRYRGWSGCAGWSTKLDRDVGLQMCHQVAIILNNSRTRPLKMHLFRDPKST